jgi:branched-chain amino acid transport system ATP-binding protein
MTTPVLQLDDVSAGYGPFRALFGVSLSVGAGEAVALVGSNGSGKTTVARVASGLVCPSSGAIHVDGADLTGRRTYEFARAGVAHAPEGRSVFGSLTIEENLTLSFRRVFGRRGVRPHLDRAYELFPVLGRRKGQTAGTLSGGEQRMLSMARVMVEKPKVLIADELSLGLAPIMVQELLETVRGLKARGMTMIIVEQSLNVALSISDRAIFMEKGQIRFEGPAEELAARDDLARAVFLGS